MYFYVHASGHSGSNLFDHVQPVLYYGMVSSRLNIDLIGEDLLRPLRKNAIWRGRIRRPKLQS